MWLGNQQRNGSNPGTVGPSQSWNPSTLPACVSRGHAIYSSVALDGGADWLSVQDIVRQAGTRDGAEMTRTRKAAVITLLLTGILGFVATTIWRIVSAQNGSGFWGDYARRWIGGVISLLLILASFALSRDKKPS